MVQNSSSPAPPRMIEKELENLNQRRSAIDRLIRSLEDYQRCQPASVPGKKLKVA